MSAPIPSYRLKIDRAKRHIRELAEEIEAFHARKPYSIFTEDDTATGQRLWKVRVKEHVPPAWSGIVGDAIHNARASLDLLMVAVVRHCDPNRASYKHVYFPFGKTREEFEAAMRKKIRGANTTARRLVENLQPYKGGDEALWRIHELDILDKHKAIIPVGTAYRSLGLTVDMKQHFPEAEWLQSAKPITLYLRPADRQFPLQDGAALFSAAIDPPFKDDVQFVFEVAFGEGQILEGEPVVPALTQMCEFVEGIFDNFEKNILAK